MSAGANSPFFGAYNARHINAEEVASQFVPSTKFWELVRLRNSLLVGPRGSGKTHLLKMLQPKALAAWNAIDAERAREHATFWGVFVPADVNWRAQVDQRALALTPDRREEFGRAVFLSHVREAFITCILQLTRDRPQRDLAESSALKMSREDEVRFCELLSDVWLLTLKVPSLDGVRLALIEEMSSFGDRNRSHFSEYANRLFSSSVVDTARQISTIFETVFSLYDTRWALCFDELEIAPVSIQRELFAYLRSTDQRLLFKLAISPANSQSADLNNEYAASASNDFDPIPLWFTDQREREAFCRALWEKQAVHTKSNTIGPERMLARSRFQYPNEESSSGKRRYGIASEWAKDFADLESKDRSFGAYLLRKRLRSNELNEASKAQRDAVVRKIAPIVGFRNAYFAPPDNSGFPRRKVLKGPPSDIFSGWDALCTATEGNPRWFCGMASKFLLKRDDSESGIVLTRDQQAREFESSANKFLAWISAIPIEIENYNSKTWTLRKLIDAIGMHFQDSILGRNFSSDPVLGFEVDSETPPDVLKLLVSALNIGAIVTLDDREVNLTISNIVGHRFRLVHLLAPHYCLPLRSGKSRRLTTILRPPRKSLMMPPSESQKGLF